MLTEDARYNTIVLAVVFSCRGHELEAVTWWVTGSILIPLYFASSLDSHKICMMAGPVANGGQLALIHVFQATKFVIGS